MTPVGASMRPTNGTGWILVAFCMVLAVGIALGWYLRGLTSGLRFNEGASNKGEENPKDKLDVNGFAVRRIRSMSQRLRLDPRRRRRSGWR